MRSLSILQEARKKNQRREISISRAVAHVTSNPSPLEGKDLRVLAERVARAINLGSWESSSAARFNEAGDKALVDITFRSGEDLLIYTATFHRIGITWTLRGARETHQAFAPVHTIALRTLPAR